jgi:hypothetical protein
MLQKKKKKKNPNKHWTINKELKRNMQQRERDAISALKKEGGKELISA